jgi:predicted small secreted protein
MKLKNVILAAILGIVIGSISTWYIIDNSVTIQKNNLEACLVREASFCGGEDLGGLRINMVKCNGKQELCLCGNPRILKKGLK